MIKFRAWGRDGNHPGTPSEKFEMFYDVSVVTTYQDKEQHVIADFGMYNESEYNGTEIIDYTLMQSTGLFDKNGVEVFEGDILYYPEQDEDKYGYIEFDKDRLAFVLDNGFEKFVYGEYGMGYIVGNIYENPELLESMEE